MKNTKKILLSLSVLIVILLGLYFYSSYMTIQVATLPEFPENPDMNICSKEQATMCNALMQKDSTMCEGIESNHTKHSCFIKSSWIHRMFKSKDKSLCDEIQQGKEDCLNFVDAAVANDISRCTSEGCTLLFRWYLAISSNNPELCDDIPDRADPKLCKLILTKDSAYCDNSHCTGSFDNEKLV